MSAATLDVAIIGGGPGGLTLAHGLRRAGLAVRVFEKDPVRADYLQGFRMRIRQRGLDALQACLPPSHFAAFLDTLGRAPVETVHVDETLRPLPGFNGPRDPESSPDDTHLEKSVSRITLRQILLAGLEDVLETGAIFAGYEEDAEGVTVRFEGGRTVRAALLVGADGAGSRVRAQRLPGERAIDTGVRRLAGKMTLDAAEERGLPRMLLDLNVHVRPAGEPGMMVTSHLVDPSAYVLHGAIGQDDPGHRGLGGFHFDNTTSYVWWNIAYPREALASDSALAEASGDRLLHILGGRIGHWHPGLVALVRGSEPSTVACLRVKSSIRVPPWPPSRVTLMGDAIHAMTYFRALGGNSAILDAWLLTEQLAQVAREGKPLSAAVGDYEAAMRDHGFAAVESSLNAMLQTVAPERTAAA